MRATRRASRLAGFTLVEIMVVVLIIGIVTAGMLLSLKFAGKDTELQTESKRLVALMNYAREQAELQTRDYGIVFSQNGYEFVVYDVQQGAWRQVSEDDALRERTLPNGLDFKLVVDAQPLVLSDSIKVPATPASNTASGSQPPLGGSQPQPGSQPQQSPVPPHYSPVPPTGSGSNSDSGSDSDSDSDSDSSSDSDSAATAFAPQVMIFSSGDLSSFNITLERESAGRSITLHENQDGDIVAKPMVESGT